MSKITIVEGNSNDKDNVRALMVKGERGYSAYEIAVQNGYEGTEAEWKDSYINAETYYNKTETDNLLDEKTCIYDTVALMKAATLKNGMTVQTLGYYSINDGGHGEYVIVDDETLVDDGGLIHVLNNGLRAKLIITNNVNIKQLGAVENEDISDIVESSLNKLGYSNLSEGIYKCNINIDSDDYIKIRGNNTTLVPENSSYPIINIECNSITKLKSIESIIFNLDNNEIGLSIKLPAFVDNYYPQMINIKDIKGNCANTFTGKVINLEYLREFNIENIYIKRLRGDDSSRTGTGIDCLSCMNLNIKDSNIGFLDKAIYIHNGTMSSEGIQMDNVEMFFNNYGVYAISNSAKAILNLKIENCMIDQVQTSGILLDGVTTSSVLNNWIGTNETNANSIDILSTNRENYGIIISNNTIWHNNQNDSYCIQINRSSSYNIRNTNISDNNMFNYHLYAINDISTTVISNIRISNNTFETTSSDSNNKFLHYSILPNNIIINNNINNGSPYYDDNILNINNNININNRKILTRISIFAGNTNQTITERYTQNIPDDTIQTRNQTVTVLINPRSSYSIIPNANATISNIYGIYI